jgi:arabinose-5-phosphate isomerase
MRTDAEIPRVAANTSVIEGLMEMTSKGLGMTAVADDDNRLQGIFTDGDLRRRLDAGIDLHTSTMEQVMTSECKTTYPEMLAAEAVHLLEQYNINSLVVVDDAGILVGALNVHDLFRAGVM